MLPPETDRAWRFLKRQPALKGFVLVGGSGLALRIKHRFSEDLDLAFPGERLPRRRMDALLRRAQREELSFERNDNEAALEEFALGGMELHDHQQDFIVNRKVKVSFFCPETALRRILAGRPSRGVRVATLDQLFRTKCLVSARRSKTRDWLDLFLLFRDHGFAPRDYREAFISAGLESEIDIGLSRLCSGIPQRDDEGYDHLLSNPPSLDQMKDFFVALRNQLEIDCSAQARSQRPRRQE